MLGGMASSNVRGWIAAVVLVGVGCAFSSDYTAEDTGMPEPVPPNCDNATFADTEACPVGGTGGEGADCLVTADCSDGLVCTAAFDGEIGRFSCQSTCIDDRDEARWCIDDMACCSAGSHCSPRGYCLPGTGGATEGTTGSVDDTGTGGTAGTGASETGTTAATGGVTTGSDGTTATTTGGSTGA